MYNLSDCLTLINQWRQNYQGLHDILNSEQLALEKREFEQITQMLKQKDKQLALIEKQSLDINGFNQLGEFCRKQNTLSKPWSDFIQLVESCRLKNEVNARLINLLQVSSKRTFNLIKGFDPDNNIYNASGDRATVRYQQRSVSA